MRCWRGEESSGERGPPQRLLNVYGPTETTTFATWYQIKAEENCEGRIPIGGRYEHSRFTSWTTISMLYPLGWRARFGSAETEWPADILSDPS